MYYVPPISGLNNIAIVKVEVEAEKHEVYLVKEVEGAGQFRTSREYLFPTKDLALEQLTRNTLDFLDNVVHSYKKATEDFNG